MATMMLTTVGTVVGTAVGGPVGGFIGGQIGRSLGGAIEGSAKKHYEGARLEELAVQTSTYGKVIPKLWGSMRLAGNVIWSRPMKETVTTTTVSGGGKGGGATRSKSTSNDYSYYVTLAVAICEGEITRLDRVWADAKLLDLSQGTYRLYRGTDTQMPDPLIESFHGVGTTPAYRGMAYVVIEDFPLAEFGNRIPNFTFEVTRCTPQRDDADLPVESMVTSLMLIPGSGEFVYDTTANFKVSGEDVAGNWVKRGFEIPLNQHTPDGKANVLVALDQMQQTFPNLEWLGVAVNWFGTSMDIASCEVWPSVEYQAHSYTEPSSWSVAGMGRTSARQIGSDAGQLRYGGTPDDAGIVRLCAELRARGLKVFFYPMMLMDVAGKPWRGLLTGSAADVGTFFTKTRGYKNFILHYANLMAGKVDAFAIGSELRDLTKISSAAGVFPAVSQLVTLAGQVKAILGSSVKITYAADWSEYHHTDGGWHHMDALWACDAIDVVGIDAYFPLTDAVQTDYDVHAVKAGWTSGEGYDWYYSDVDRTVKTALTPDMAWKNIEYWWKHTHTNPDGSTTGWVPQSKPLWFTEYGFASVDGCTNEPNVFVDGATSASAYPRFSKGRVDFMAQRVAIAATEAQWGDNGIVSRRFLWTWDARPYPYWPDLRDVWADGGAWMTGHWVQGKLGTSHVAAVVEELAATTGLDTALLDTSALQMGLDGFILNSRTSARAALEQLMQAYFFSMRETGGKLVALPRQREAVDVIDASECLPMTADGREVAYLLRRAEDLILPAYCEVQSLNRLQRYGTQVQAARRGMPQANEVESIQVALVLSDVHARMMAETMLADRWAERSQVTFQLPMRYAALEAGDVVTLMDDGQAHRVRLMQVQLGRPGMVRIKGVVDASEQWDGYIPPTIGGSGDMVAPPAGSAMAVLDIPAFPGEPQDALSLRLAVCGTAANWSGASVVRVASGLEDALVTDVISPATMGQCTTMLGTAFAQLIDYAQTVDVALLGEGALASVSIDALLRGANVALVGDEIIQFANATLLAPGKYRLSTLLRGRQGTEWAMAGHVEGERFVLLDAAVLSVTLPGSAVGQNWRVRAVSAGSPLNQGTEVTVKVAGSSLKPLAPVRPDAVRDGSDDVTFSWCRRARIDGGLRDAVEIPLMEQAELYDVSVMSGGVAVRSWQVVTPHVIYTASQQVTDFGSLQPAYTLKIAQRSAQVGPGTVLLQNVVVR